MCAALDVAALHLLRNAIDHGIEEPPRRAVSGKERRGTITVRANLEADRLRLEVADDGAGIDFAEVSRRAIGLGLLAPNVAATEAQLAEVLFQPGFSTRAVATEVSGRGVGLDAVSGAVAAVGGKLSVTSKPGKGARWAITIPASSRKVAAYGFAVPGSPLRFAIATDWTVAVVPSDERATGAIDLAEIFGVASATSFAGPSVLLRVARAEMAIHFIAAWPPVEVTVRRLLVTPPDANAEGRLDRRQLRGPARAPRSLEPGHRPDRDPRRQRDLSRDGEGERGAVRDRGVVSRGSERATIGTLAIAGVDLLLLDLSFEQLDLTELIRRVRTAIPDLTVYLHSDRPIARAPAARRGGDARRRLSLEVGGHRLARRQGQPGPASAVRA